MADGEDRSSKTEAPTARRLEQAREDGQIAKSAELASLAPLAAACAVMLISGGGMATRITAALAPFLAHPDAIDLSPHGAVAVLHQATLAAWPGAMVMLVAAAAGTAGHMIQQGFVFTPKAIAPDFSKIGLGAGFKRLLGLDNVINFAKSLAKLIGMSLVVYAVLKPRAGELAAMTWVQPAAILPLAIDALRAVVVAALLVFAISAGADVFIQRMRHTSRLRMSREDIKQESKDADGDPHIKARLRQIRVTRAKTRMIQNVPKATLVIMNPTHFAVALRYVQGETPAPVCVAKGVDEVALKIRAVAEEHRVAVIEDPPLARALYAAIEVDETIPREHYDAVAKIVGFVMSAGRRRAPPLGSRRAGGRP